MWTSWLQCITPPANHFLYIFCLLHELPAQSSIPICLPLHISNHVLRESAIPIRKTLLNRSWYVYSNNTSLASSLREDGKSLFLTLRESERIHQWNLPSISEIVSCWELHLHPLFFLSFTGFSLQTIWRICK